MKKIFFVATPVLFLLNACKKESTTKPVVPPVQPVVVKSELSIEFDNRIKDAELHLALQSYTSEIYAEEFTFTGLKYYISNISLTNTGDTVYTVPQDSSYFLIDQDDLNLNSRFPTVKVPVGDYKTLTFVLGVDSLRSTMDISKRTGVLDPSAGGSGMYWGRDSGYIFFKLDGKSPVSPEPDSTFKYYIGGYGGAALPFLNNVKTISIDLTAHGIAQVRTGTKSNIHLMADISKIFDSNGHPMSIAAHPVVMFDSFSTNVSYSYANMFRHDHTENERSLSY